MSAPISEAKCEDMKAMRRRGYSLNDIAEAHDVHRTTAYNHTNNRCEHNHTPVTEATVTFAVARLADELGRIPTIADWSEWDDAPCGIMKAQEVSGGWTTAIENAGLPTVPENVPKSVRIAAYREVHD